MRWRENREEEGAREGEGTKPDAFLKQNSQMFSPLRLTLFV